MSWQRIFLKEVLSFQDVRWTVRYLLCVPGFCGHSVDVVHKQMRSGQDTEQGRAIEQRLHII